MKKGLGFAWTPQLTRVQKKLPDRPSAWLTGLALRKQAPRQRGARSKVALVEHVVQALQLVRNTV
jgi:hypothetical protein